MPQDFAKLFRHPTHGQVLVTLDRGDDGMEICIRITGCHGVASEIHYKFEDDAEGVRLAEAEFNATDKAKAFHVADGLAQMVASAAAPSGSGEPR